MSKITFGTGGFRGVIGEDFTKENVQRIAQGLADMVASDGVKTAVPIGFDNRFLSDAFARWMAEVLAANGINCLLYDSPVPTPMVMCAVRDGFCEFGVLPIENSTAGSVNAVYDLMMRHHFHIVRSVRVKIDHNLLARPGAKLSGIREIYSHEQALSQCAQFLSSLPGVKVIPCENTALAAKLVAESGRDDAAALSTRACERLYGLECLAPSVQDTANNYTRFICIARDLEIYPGADRTSLMMTLRHEPGSLYKVLSRFYALGINLNKLESRPLPERSFEFMFYFDLENPVYDPAFRQLVSELGDISEEYTYLGSYSEVI